MNSISISQPARVISWSWALIFFLIWWSDKNIFYITVTCTGLHREPLLIVADAMSYVCMWKKKGVLILCWREQTKWIGMCKTGVYKCKQACGIRLFTRCDQSGATRARYIKGLGDLLSKRWAMRAPWDRAGLGPRGPTDSIWATCKMKKRQKGEGLRYRTPPGASLDSALLPLFWEPSQKELGGVWETWSPKANVRNMRKIHSPRFKIKQLCCKGDLAQSHMTGSRPLSPVFYYSLTHLNAPQKKSPRPCPIRKPALFFLYTALHYPHTTRWRDASERSIYSGRGWGAMNLCSSVFKLKEKLRSCCVHQLSHALYWRVNKTPAFNLYWKEIACRDRNRQYAQTTMLFD